MNFIQLEGIVSKTLITSGASLSAFRLTDAYRGVKTNVDLVIDFRRIIVPLKAGPKKWIGKTNFWKLIKIPKVPLSSLKRLEVTSIILKELE